MAEYTANQVITRYLNFEKFVTLLSLGLFIPRVDMFEDRLEGIIPYPDANTVGFNIEDDKVQEVISELKDLKNPDESSIFYILNKNIEYYLNSYKYIKNNPYSDITKLMEISYKIKELLEASNNNANIDIEIENNIRQIFFNIFKETFKETLVSCWHIGTQESLPMWGLYAENKGIAIQTTIGKMESAIKKSNYSTVHKEVTYNENYEKNFKNWSNKNSFLENIKEFEKSNDDNITYPYFWLFQKRKCFEYEKEYRFIIDYESILTRLFKNNDKKSEKMNGAILKIDNNSFIDKIIIAPKANEIFINLIKSIIKDYGIEESKLCISEIGNLC